MLGAKTRNLDFDGTFLRTSFSFTQSYPPLLMDVDFEVAVSYTHEVPENIPGEFISSLEDAGIDVETEKRESEPYAGLEWLLPTAIIVYLSEKYFGTMIQKMAEDHYSAIKKELIRLVNRTAGPGREVEFGYVTSSPEKVSSDKAPPLSIYTKLSDGRPIKFIIEKLPREEDVSLCVYSLVEFMNDHYGGDSKLDGKLNENSRKEVVMRFDTEKEVWYLAYPDSE